MSTEQQQQKQFVKNTQKPSDDSELWAVADGWKISQQTGLTYTSLDDIFKTQNDHQFHDALVKQLNGKIKQSLDIGLGYLFVASYSQNGKALVYAYDPSRKEDADKRASYNKPQEPQQKLETVPEAANQPPPQQQQQTILSQPQQQQNKQSEFIKIIRDSIEVEADDEQGITELEKAGLYEIPVVYVGTNNYGYFHPETGKKMYKYGRVVLKRITEE